MRRSEHVWCQPGRCTPSASRMKQIPPTPVGITVVGLHTVLDPKMSVKSDRVHRMPKSSSIEEHCELEQHQDQVGAVHASNSSSTVFNADAVTASKRVSTRGDTIFIYREHVRDRVYNLK